MLTDAITQEPGLVLDPDPEHPPSLHQGPHLQPAPARRAEPGGRPGQAAMRGAHRRERRLIWFLPPGSDPDPVAACTRIQMRTFDPGKPPRPVPGVVPLDEVAGRCARRSARSPGSGRGGFAFLDARIRERGTGPVLACQRDGKIVGAIGPMETMPDSRGTARLLPQYFGVLPEYRGHGLGRCLWRAAMHWGQETRPPTSSCKPRPAGHPTACAGPKG